MKMHIHLMGLLATIVLLVCSALGAIACIFISKYRLPISYAVPLLTTILPSIDSLTAYRSIIKLGPRSHRKNRPLSPWLLLLNLSLLVLIGILLSQSTQFLGKNECILKDAWQSWFSAKDANPIRDIQTKLQCCGFHKQMEMPFPFPTQGKGKDHEGAVPPSACQGLLGSDASCYQRWDGQMRIVGGLLVAANAIMLLKKLVFMVSILGNPERLERLFTQNSYEDANQNRTVEEVYGDDDHDDQEGREVRGRVTAGEEHTNGERANSKTRLLLPKDHGSRSQPVMNDEEAWRSDR